MNIWRLLITSPNRGAWNMAVDEAILESVGSGASLPTLRLYAWEPACLSIGYAQPLTDVDIPRLQARRWDLVRRLTGGRAVLHSEEITYSVIAPIDEPHVAGSVLESYNHLAEALVETLRLINIPVEVQENAGAGNRNPNPVCFEVPSSSEITSGGRKLIGSAQARRKEGILQHGSLPLSGDLARILQVLVFPDEEARSRETFNLLEKATTVETVLRHKVSWDEAAQAYTTAFQSVLGLDLQQGELSLLEEARAAHLAEVKYIHADWNQKNQKI
jgi:lipoate-protein ligase A